MMKKATIYRCLFACAVLLSFSGCESLSTNIVRIKNFIDGQDRIEMEGSTANVTPLVVETADLAHSTTQESSDEEPSQEFSLSEKAEVKIEENATKQQDAVPTPKTIVEVPAQPSKETEKAKLKEKPSPVFESVKKIAVSPAEPNIVTGNLSGRVSVEVENTTDEKIDQKSIIRLIPLVDSIIPAVSEDLTKAPSDTDYDTVSVNMLNKKYDPTYLSVKKNDMVVFLNSDKIRHNVFSRSGKNAFDLGTYAAGKKRGVSFKESGIVKVYCNIHPKMATFISVVDHGYSQVTNDDGHFTFDNIPEGRYTLEAWNIRGQANVEVVISQSQPTEVSIVIDKIDPDFLDHENKFGEKYPEKPILFEDEFY